MFGMKYLCTFLCIINFSFLLHAQNCNQLRVIKIIGAGKEGIWYNYRAGTPDTLFQLNRTLIKTGLRVSKAPEGEWKVVLFSGCGQVVYSSHKSESWSLITYLSPFKYKVTQTNTRGGNEYFHYLQQLFSASNRPHVPNILGIVGEEYRFAINTEEIPLSDNKYFLIKYIYKDINISKKIPFEGNEIILNKKIIYNIDGLMITSKEASKMQLYYYNSSDVNDIKETYVCHLKLHFEDNTDILEEINGYQTTKKED